MNGTRIMSLGINKHFYAIVLGRKHASAI